MSFPLFLSRTSAASFRLLVLPLLVVVSLAVACGGDDNQTEFNDVGAQLDIDFPTEVPTLHPLLDSMTPAQRRLLQVDYLQRMSGMVKQTQNLVRELESYVDEGRSEGSGSGADLDWVIGVYDTSERANQYLDYQAGFALPASLSAYSDMHSLYLEVLEGVSAGQVALLEATVTLGPSGRTYADLDYVGKAEFAASVGRADYYLEETGDKIGRIQEFLQVSLREVR